jgi:hypothetical protein
MANGQVSASERAAYEQAMAQAELDAVLADTQTKMDLIKARRGAQAAYQDSVQQAKEKAAKERQAQDEKAQKQAQAGGKDKGLTTDWGDQPVSTQNPTANVQQGAEMPSPGGGVGPFTSGPEGPGAGGGAGMGLPGVPEAPPFLVSQRQQSEVGPHHFFPHMVAPARTTRRTTDIQPNVISAGDRAGLIQQRAFNQARLEQQGRRDLVGSFRDIADVTGDVAVSAAAAHQFRLGNTERAFEILSKGGQTPAARVADARVAASESTHNRNLLTMAKRQLEIKELKLRLENLPIENAAKALGLVKLLGEVDLMDKELRGSSPSRAARHGYSSSPEDNRMDDKQFNDAVKGLFMNSKGLVNMWSGNRNFDESTGANADSLQVEAFERGYLLSIKDKDSSRVPLEQALEWLDDVYLAGKMTRDYDTGKSNEYPSDEITARGDAAAKKLSDLGFSQGGVFNVESYDAGLSTTDIFLGPKNDDLANSTSSDLLFKEWLYRGLGGDEEVEELNSLGRQAREMLIEVLSRGAQ